MDDRSTKSAQDGNSRDVGEVSIRAEIAKIFGEMRSEIEQAERRALALLEAKGTETPIAPRWISMKAAAMEHGCTIETMTRHVIQFGLGVKIGGRWQVDDRRLQAWRNSQPYTPLRATDLEDEFDVLRGPQG